MAIHLRQKSFQSNLLLTVGGLFAFFAICFGLYQSTRERNFKRDILHARLQMYNYEMMQDLGPEGISDRQAFLKYVEHKPIKGLRVTIIAENGDVLQESHSGPSDSLGNHLNRREISQALAHGSGFDIKRRSESTNETYFYSATRFGKIIIRSAVPYSSELTESLKADNTYIIYLILLTLLLFAVLWYNISLYMRLREAEREKNRIKRELTQNMAHELKTPAYSINGFLESILDNPDMGPAKREHFLERCYAQSNRMTRILTDMTALTGLDAIDENERSLEKRPADLGDIIYNVMEDTALQLKEKGIKRELLLPKNTRIMGDSGLLYSIFRNITDNTLAYATGATLLKICVREETSNTSGTCYYVTMSDNGQGVGEEHLPHLFERFYRVDKGRSRRLGGTGLGLAIVKNAVAAHGGTIWAEATPGVGLTICFTLNKE